MCLSLQIRLRFSFGVLSNLQVCQPIVNREVQLEGEREVVFSEGVTISKCTRLAFLVDSRGGQKGRK